MGFYVLKGRGATTNSPGWVFRVENRRPNVVLSSMMLIPANCIVTAASQYYLHYSALVRASRGSTVCLLPHSYFFDAFDTLWSPAPLSCHRLVSIFSLHASLICYVSLCKVFSHLVLFCFEIKSYSSGAVFSHVFIVFLRFFDENLLFNMYKAVLSSFGGHLLEFRK